MDKKNLLWSLWLLSVLTIGLGACQNDDDDELDVETTQEEQTKNSDETGSEEEEVVVTYAATITNTDLAAVLAATVEGVTLDEEGNALITQEVIDSTTELDISEQELTSLSGIECFVNLTSLNCSGNPLDEFDVSDLTNLQVLNCSSCFGQTVSRNYSDGTLDVSALINLLELDCSSNNLTVLIVSENEQLVILDCSSNSLTELDLSNNAELEELYCSSNSLTELDLSNNTGLTVVVCYDNQLTTLDVSTITALETLLCGSQQTDGDLILVVSDAQLELWESELEGEDENQEVVIIKDEDSTNDSTGDSGDSGSEGEDEDTQTDDTSDVEEATHEAVDLGLSVKWATMNIGAASPEDYGNYYAWGETATKSTYSSSNSVTYDVVMDDFSGNVEYDAATANWGDSWRMPTYDEMEELVDNCTWKWTKQNSVGGYLVTGTNGNSIFLPAAGSYEGSSLDDVARYGRYWSSTPNYWASDCYAQSLVFINGLHSVGSGDRSSGRSVRPVTE